MIFDVAINIKDDRLLESDRYPLKQVLGVARHTVFVDVVNELRCMYCNNLLSFFWKDRWYTYVLNDPNSEGNSDLNIVKAGDYLQFSIDTDILESNSVENLGKKIRRRW